MCELCVRLRDYPNSVNAYIHNGEKVKGHHWLASGGNTIGTFETSTTFSLLCNQDNVLLCRSFVEQ